MHARTPFLNGQRQRRRQYRIPRTNAPPTLDQPPSNHGRPFERRVSVHARNTPLQRESSAHRPAQPYKHGAKHSMRRAPVQCAHTRTSSMCIRTTHKRSKLRWPPTPLRCHTGGTSDMRFQISFSSPSSTTRFDTQRMPPRGHSPGERNSHSAVPLSRDSCEGYGKTLTAPSPPQQDTHCDGFSHRPDGSTTR